MYLSSKCIVEHKANGTDFHSLQSFGTDEMMIAPGASSCCTIGSSSSSCSCGAISLIKSE